MRNPEECRYQNKNWLEFLFLVKNTGMCLLRTKTDENHNMHVLKHGVIPNDHVQSRVSAVDARAERVGRGCHGGACAE